MPNLHLRAARTDDTVALVALLTDTYRRTWLPQLRAEAAARFEREDLFGHYVTTHVTDFWVAEHTGELIGMVHWQGDFIEALHVHGRWQQQGIGGTLLQLAETRMAAAGVTLARLETDTFNQQSRSFYRRHGYQEVAQYPDLEWDSGFTTVLLQKALG